MSKNKPQKNTVLLRTTIIVLAVVFVLLIPSHHKARAVVPLPFGGRISFFSPFFYVPYTTIVCPPLSHVLSIGGPYKGIIHIFIPPTQPRLYYNFYTPATSARGSFMPIPIWQSCTPFQPIYSGIFFGTSGFE